MSVNLELFIGWNPKNHNRVGKHLNFKTMKKIFSVLLVSVLVTSAFTRDVMILNNQMAFEGRVSRIKDCSVIFRVDGERYEIPAEDIFAIKFEDVDNRIYRNYIHSLQTNPEKCMSGTLDANNHHGKAGGHVVLGVLFGPFAVIGAAVANPTPEKGARTMMMSPNPGLFNDPAYLSCYTKKAKSQNVVHTALGWAVWIFILLL